MKFLVGRVKFGGRIACKRPSWLMEFSISWQTEKAVGQVRMAQELRAPTRIVMSELF